MVVDRIHWTMHDETTFEQRLQLRNAALDDGDQIAAYYQRDQVGKLLIIWSNDGKARAFIIDEDNRHWACPSLDYLVAANPHRSAYSLLV